MSVPGPGARAAPPSGRILHPSHIASRGLKGSALRRRPWTKAGHIPTSPAVLPASGSPCKPQPPSSHASARSFNNSARSMRTLPWRGTSVLPDDLRSIEDTDSVFTSGSPRLEKGEGGEDDMRSSVESFLLSHFAVQASAASETAGDDENPMDVHLRIMGRGDGAVVPANIVRHWLLSFRQDQSGFASFALFLEMKLRQLLHLAAELPAPNGFLTAFVCWVLHSLCHSVRPSSAPALREAASVVFRHVFLTPPGEGEVEEEFFRAAQYSAAYVTVSQELARLQAQLEQQKARHTKLVEKLDRRKITYRLVIEKWRYNSLGTVFAAWRRYTVVVSRNKFRQLKKTRTFQALREVMNGHLKLIRTCFNGWLSHVNASRQSHVHIAIRDLQRKVTLYQAQLPALEYDVAQLVTRRTQLMSTLDGIRAEQSERSATLSRVMLFLEKKGHAAAGALLSSWSSAALAALTLTHNRWLAEIAQARSSCVDGTVLHEDLSVCKPLAGKALFDAGKALCEGGSLAPTLIRSGLCDLPGSEDVGWASECPLPLGPLFGLRALNLPLPPRRRTLAAEAPPLSLGSTYSSVGEWPCDHVPPLDSVARAVRQLDATSVMLRWANILLSSAAAQLFYTYCKETSGEGGMPPMHAVATLLQSRQRLHGFGTELKDGKLLTLLLHTLAPAAYPASRTLALLGEETAKGEALYDLAEAVRALGYVTPAAASACVGPPSLLPCPVLSPPAAVTRVLTRMATGLDSPRMKSPLLIPEVKVRFDDRPTPRASPRHTFVPRASPVPLGKVQPPPPQQQADVSPWFLFQAKDVFQGNPVWATAGLAVALSPSHFPIAAVHTHYGEAQTAAAAEVMARAAAAGEECGRMGTACTSGAEDAYSVGVGDPAGVQTGVARVCQRALRVRSDVGEAVEAARVGHHCWDTCVWTAQNGVWHRVAGMVANTMIDVDTMTLGGSPQSVASRRKGGSITATSPSDFGRTGSRKLVDLKESRLAPFATITRSKISDVLKRSQLADADYQRVCDVLSEHAGLLYVLFSHYASLSGPAGGKASPKRSGPSPGTVMNKHQFWRFVKDALFLNEHRTPADIDHVLLVMCKFDDESSDRRKSVMTGPRAAIGAPHRPSVSSFQRRSVSYKPPSLTSPTHDGTESSAIEQQLERRRTVNSARRVVTAAGRRRWLGKEQFVEAVVRLAAYDPASLGTGVGRVLDVVIKEQLLPLIQQPPVKEYTFRAPAFLTLFHKHKPWLRALFSRFAINPLLHTEDGGEPATLKRNNSIPSASRKASGALECGIIVTEARREEEATPLGTACAMGPQGWLRALTHIDAIAPSGRFTRAVAEGVFKATCPPQDTSDVMVFAEFCEALAHSALLLDPAPWRAPITRVEAWFDSWKGLAV